VPSRLGSKIPILLAAKSSFSRKYSEMIRRKRNKINIKKFFILKKKRPLIQAAVPSNFDDLNTMIVLNS
jgi:hypothetical protein